MSQTLAQARDARILGDVLPRWLNSEHQRNSRISYTILLTSTSTNIPETVTYILKIVII